MILALKESERFGRDYVGTEQLLMGLVSERDGVAARALRSAGLTPQNLRANIHKIIGDAEEVELAPLLKRKPTPFTPKAKIAVQRAVEEAQKTNQETNTEHMLLALIDSSGVAVTVLENMAVDLTALQKRVQILLQSEET